MTTTTSDIRIYVASLSDYNAGILHGVHITLDSCTEVDEVWEQINEMLKNSVATKKYGDIAEEWAIHDHEGFGDYRVSEYESIEKLVEIAAFLSEHGDLARAWLANGNDADAEAMQEAHAGTFDNDEDFARNYVDDCGWKSLTSEQIDELDIYLDWDAIARDLLWDYWSAEVDGGTAYFRSH